uniref:Transcription initiation factor IIE subunit alpha-like n=1 Tax=Nicotiana tabacum TaxID=4097 RepID=A0A1S4BDM5_TOBAC|nr:PREDICTED: transcription initiation factor IIE subunit alpha-like [Nicotiana tabacum]
MTIGEFDEKAEVISEVAGNLENSEEVVEEEESWREEGGSGSGDASAIDGLVRLRKRFQELVPSVKEPLEELLKKVSDSYNPKKKKSSGVKIPGTARAHKKRKTASSIPVETPPTRGSATRSQKKSSEAELERALEKSKRKADAKGKKKVSEHVEAIEIEGMDLVLHDEDGAEEVEVMTPKAKKRKTSKKKSPSKTVDVKLSTLAKRTRSAVKSRKVQVVKEEESEEEEEADEEREKMVNFGKRTILKGRLLKHLEEEGMAMLIEKIELQGWKDMVLQVEGRLEFKKFREFSLRPQN